MTAKKILTISKHEKILRTPSEPVKKINKEIKQLIEDIKDTIDANPAMGLAAVQIGVLKRVFGARLGMNDQAQDDEETEIEVDERDFPPTIFINPEIVEQSEDLERDYDGCLSIPGMVGFTDRKLKLKVKYMDEHGKTVERELTSMDARVFQHELDHLEGILFLDRLSTMDDLYVYVKDKDGNVDTVPYLKARDQAVAPINTEKLAKSPIGKSSNPPKTIR
jgi:peptide deformylase